MANVLGFVLLGLVILGAIAAATGRLKATSCCAMAYPRNDLRMADAFHDEQESRS
jgi:hypothetical protein